MKLKSLILLFTLQFSLNVFASTKIRIGWQVPWSVQGQLVQIWKHTDILKKHNLEAEFIGRTFGPELNELALADAIDVVLTGDQPAATLFSKNKGWVGISRLMYNRTATYVPVNSHIKKLSDLKGKTIGLPFGAAAQRVLIENLIAAGLDPKSDLKFVNLGMLEHPPLIKKAGADSQTWDQFDALSGFDPYPAIFEQNKMVRIIDTGKVCSLVLLRKDFMTKNPTVAKDLSLALKEAYLYYRKNKNIADKWFLEEARIDGADTKSLQIASSLENNLNAKHDKDVKLDFSEDDYILMQKGADFVGLNLGIKINMKDYVSNEYIK